MCYCNRARSIFLTSARKCKIIKSCSTYGLGRSTIKINGTVNFNGGSTQAVGGATFYDLTLSGAGQKNASGAVTVAHDLTNSSVFDLAGNALYVTGSITNTGTISFS